MADSHKDPADDLGVADHVVVLEIQRHGVQAPSANRLGEVGTLRYQHTNDVVAQSLPTARIDRTLNCAQAEHASAHLVLVRVCGQRILNARDDRIHEVDINDDAQLGQRLGSYATVYGFCTAECGEQDLPRSIQPGMGLQVQVKADGKLRLSGREDAYIRDAPQNATNVVGRVLSLFRRQLIRYE